jgi:Sodium:sulfate symporter transmembrane region
VVVEAVPGLAAVHGRLQQLGDGRHPSAWKAELRTRAARPCGRCRRAQGVQLPPLLGLWLNRPEVKRVEGVEEFIAEKKRRLGRVSAGERNTLLAFGVAITLWTLPGLVGLFVGDDSKLYEGLTDRWLDEDVVAVLAAGLLFVLPIDWGRRQFTLNWNQASRIDWGTILLFGSGIALGSLMRETGLAKSIGEGLANTLNVSNPVSIAIVCVIIAVIISKTTSNTASAAIVVPIAIAISGAVGVDPVIPAMAAIFGANYGFMLPVSTPPNAIVYSSACSRSPAWSRPAPCSTSSAPSSASSGWPSCQRGRPALTPTPRWPRRLPGMELHAGGAGCATPGRRPARLRAPSCRPATARPAHLGQHPLVVFDHALEHGEQLLLGLDEALEGVAHLRGGQGLGVVAAHGQVAGGGHLSGDGAQAGRGLALLLGQAQVDGMLLSGCLIVQLQRLHVHLEVAGHRLDHLGELHR